MMINTAIPSIMRYIPNGIKVCFFTKSVKSFTVITDTRNDTVKATVSTVIAKLGKAKELSRIKEKNSNIFSALAPKIIGIAAKKENSVASRRSVPRIRAPSIVAPERDVPGIMAKD